MKPYILFCLLLVFGAGAMAQGNQKIKSQKVAFLTHELDLSVDESMSFWPVYNAFEKEKEAIQKKKHLAMRRFKNTPTLSNSQLDTLANQVLNSGLALAHLQKNYHAKFLEVLPIRKVLTLYTAEQKFKKWLLREIRRKGNRNKRSSKE